MTPVPTAPTTAPEAVTPPPRRAGRRSMVIENVSWETYEKVMEAFGDRRGVRFAYDNGALEIMTPISLEHEGDGNFLGWLMPHLAGAFGHPLRGGGSVTMTRKDALKGIEPDNCYWLANAPKLAGVKRLNLTIHPPPDLAVEVDVTSDSLDKFPIYAAIGVPEFWRLDGDDLRFYKLGADGRYTEVPVSVAFPTVAPSDLMPFLRSARAADDQVAVLLAFGEWVKTRAGGGA